MAVLFLAMGLRIDAAPNQMVPKGLGDTVTIPDMLRYRVPGGWSTNEETNASPQARGPVSNGVVPDITFNPGNHGTLSDLKDTFNPTYYDDISGVTLKVTAQTSFVTSAGVKGARVRLVDTASPSRVVQYSYIFLSADGQELELACACAEQDEKVYLPVFEASMKTVQIAKGD